MSIKIADLEASTSRIDVVAIVQLKSEVKSYGKSENDRYMFVHLFDGNQIKLTVFGSNNCKLLDDIQVS